MADPPGNPPVAPTGDDDLVHVVSPVANEVVRVPRSQLEQARAHGYALASPEQIQQRQDVEQYGGIGGMLEAGAAGVGRALTFGASDVIANAFGANETLEKLRRVNPGASLIGETAGTIAGGVLSGGESLVARTLSAPTRAVMALGEGAGAVAERALGEGLVSSAVRGTVEGAAIGATQAVSEAALTDRYDQLGELLASNVGLGAMLGGSTSLGLSLLGRGARAIGSAAKAKLAGTIEQPGESALASVQAQHFGATAPEQPGVAARAFGKLASTVGAGDAGDIASFVSTGEAGARKRALALNAEQIYESQLDTVTGALQDVHTATDQMGSLFSGEMKRDAVARMIGESGGVDAQQGAAAVRAVLDDAQQMADRIGGNPAAAADVTRLGRQVAKLERRLAAAPALEPELTAARQELARATALAAGDAQLSRDGLKVKSLHDELARARARAADGLAAGTDDGLADAYIAADQAKRAIGDRAAALRDRGGEGLHGITPSQRATFSELQTTYERMRGPLEDGAWGKVADAQRGINAAWSSVFESGEQAGGAAWKRALTEKFKDRAGSTFGIERTRISRKSVGEFFNGLTAPAESDTWKAINQQLDDRIGFIKAAQQHLALTPAQKELAAQAIESAERAKKSLGLVSETAQARSQYKALREKAGGSMAAGLIGGAVGGGHLGPLAVLGGAYGAVRNPLGIVDKLAAVEQLTGRTKKVLTDATGLHQVAALQSMAEESAARQESAFANIGRRATKLATYAVPRTGLEVASYARIKPARAEYERRAAMQRQLSGSPETVAAAVAHALADLAPHAPQTVSAATQSLTATVQYLNAQLPKLGLNGVAPALPPSTSEQHAFVQKARAVGDPDALAEQIGKGKLSPFAIDAVRATAPANYAAAQQRAIDSVTETVQAGRLPSYDDRMRMSLAFDLPLDPMADPDMMRDMQAGYAPLPPRAGGAPSQSDDVAAKRAADAARTTTDRLGDNAT